MNKLINAQTREWDEAFVKEIFVEEEAEQICRIPLTNGIRR